MDCNPLCISEAVMMIAAAFPADCVYKLHSPKFREVVHEEAYRAERFFSQKRWTELTSSNYLNSGVHDFNSVDMYLSDSQIVFYLPSILQMSFTDDWRTVAIFDNIVTRIAEGSDSLRKTLKGSLSGEQVEVFYAVVKCRKGDFSEWQIDEFKRAFEIDNSRSQQP